MQHNIYNSQNIVIEKLIMNYNDRQEIDYMITKDIRKKDK